MDCAQALLDQVQQQLQQVQEDLNAREAEFRHGDLSSRHLEDGDVEGGRSHSEVSGLMRWPFAGCCMM